MDVLLVEGPARDGSSVRHRRWSGSTLGITSVREAELCAPLLLRRAATAIAAAAPLTSSGPILLVRLVRAGAPHRLRIPLTAVLRHLDDVRDSTGDPLVQERLFPVESEVDRTGRIVGGSLALTRAGAGGRGPGDRGTRDPGGGGAGGDRAGARRRPGQRARGGPARQRRRGDRSWRSGPPWAKDARGLDVALQPARSADACEPIDGERLITTHHSSAQPADRSAPEPAVAR